jgi:hypothetical protein
MHPVKALYAYTRDAVPMAFRARLLKPRAARRGGLLYLPLPFGAAGHRMSR